MSELEYRILANLILQQTNQLFTKLVALIQILQRETLHTRIRVSLKKEKRGIKRVYSTLPLSPADIRWQLITYGYTATVSFIITSLSQIAKPIDRSQVIAIIQQSDSLRASIPTFSNSSFSPNDILKSLRQIKKSNSYCSYARLHRPKEYKYTLHVPSTRGHKNSYIP